jgi:GNAT superfamily N-acetyltransferase
MRDGEGLSRVAKQPLELRAMRDTVAELDRIDRLMMTAYESSSRRRELMLYLAVQPDGWFVITDGDEIVAAGGAIAYGPFCWLGLVATDPERRGQGLATRLSTHLVMYARERGCRTIALDASEAGRGVYERLGFRALGFTTELSLPREMPTGTRSILTVRAAESVDELIGADRRAFGADRTTLLRAIQVGDCPLCLVGRGRSGGAGHQFAHGHILGPGYASDADIACELVRAAHRNDVEQHMIVPMESRYLGAFLSLGLRVRRRLTHMRLGEVFLPGERDRLIAQTSFAAGLARSCSESTPRQRPSNGGPPRPSPRGQSFRSSRIQYATKLQRLGVSAVKEKDPDVWRREPLLAWRSTSRRREGRHSASRPRFRRGRTS